MQKSGTVYLIGAGPGDPDLLTVKALRYLQEADVVVYDRLVSDEIMSLVPEGVKKVAVGKAPKHHMVPQEGINELLVELAQEAECVVRLKGGDPFIFGRGSEEAQRLVEAGVPFEVIPGITAAQGCATSLHVPLTHRGLATGVRYVTGHCRNDVPLDLNWSSLADKETTLVVYMGLAAIKEISAELIAHGMPESLPVLAISKGTTPQERHVLSDLKNIHDVAQREELKAPTLFIIGEVAAFCGTLQVPVEPCASVTSLADSRAATQTASSDTFVRRLLMVRQTIGGLPGRLFVGLGSRFSRFLSIAACASGLALSSLIAPLPHAMAQGYEFADQAELFEFVKQDCGACHGLSLKGGLGKPLLKENIDHFDLETLEEVILDGIPDTAMPPWRGLLKEEDVKAIAKALKDGKVQ